MTVTDYITPQEFRDYARDTSSENSDNVATAITASSREIDDYCGRFFYQQQDTQFFSAYPVSGYSLWILDIDDADIATTDDLVVESSTANDGTYDTVWTIDEDFILEPVNRSRNGITGWPFESLRAIGGKTWPVKYVPWNRDTIRIQATYGWPAVPLPVKQAAKILTAQYFKLGEAPLGVAGWGAYGDIKVRDIPQVAKLLRPYCKAGTWGIG